LPLIIIRSLALVLGCWVVIFSETSAAIASWLEVRLALVLSAFKCLAESHIYLPRWNILRNWRLIRK